MTGLWEIEDKSLENFASGQKSCKFPIKEKECKIFHDNFKDTKLQSSERNTMVSASMQAVISNIQHLQQKLECTEAQREVNKFNNCLHVDKRNDVADNKNYVSKIRYSINLMGIQGKLVNDDIATTRTQVKSSGKI